MALPHIQIGDGTLGDALLSSVEVVQALNEHWWCTVVCRNTEDQRIPVENLLGQSVEVKTTDDGGVEHNSGSSENSWTSGRGELEEDCSRICSSLFSSLTVISSFASAGVLIKGGGVAGLVVARRGVAGR